MTKDDAGGDAGLVSVDEGVTVATGNENHNVIQVPIDQRADITDNVDEGGSAVPVLVDEEGDVTKVVEDKGDVHVPDDGGGAVLVPIDD